MISDEGFPTKGMSKKNAARDRRGAACASGMAQDWADPAYAAKVGIWLISAALFSQFNFLLVLGFLVVYTLRAWTEERHLQMDPDYQSYQKKVRWRCLPGIH